MINRTKLVWLLISCFCCLALGILLRIKTSDHQVFSVFRIILGVVCLLFLPGYRVSLVVCSSGSLDGIERGALSFAFSLAIIPLLVFYVNLAGVLVTSRLILGVVLGVVLVCFGILVFQEKKRISAPSMSS